MIEPCNIPGCEHEPGLSKTWGSEDDRLLLELMRQGQVEREIQRQVFYANLRRTIRS